MKNNKEQLFDELLILQYQAGNKKAIDLIVKRWHKKLLLHSFRFTRNSEVSKDIVQECWIIIIKNLDQLNEPSKFGVWSYSIVTNKSIDWVRKEQKKRTVLKDYKSNKEIEASTKDGKNNQQIKLKNEIEKLPLKQQIVLKLFYTENYTIREIGSILSISIGTVKSRLFMAREQLKKCISKN